MTKDFDRRGHRFAQLEEPGRRPIVARQRHHWIAPDAGTFDDPFERRQRRIDAAGGVNLDEQQR